MCHTQQYRSWLASPHAPVRDKKLSQNNDFHGSSLGAWEALKPGVSGETKRMVGLDATADYTSDHRCLACHVVGFGQAGGYAVPEAHDKKSQRRAADRQDVGCESCHGPGSEFVQVMRDV